MIFVQDNYLPAKLFKDLQSYCSNNDFETQTVGEKLFSTLPTPKEVLPYLQADGHKMILSFIRCAHKDMDTDLRIHADNIIGGKKTSIASVLYVNDNNITTNGTCFYKHHKYGLQLPKGCTNEEFDRLINEDSNDKTKWEKTDSILSVPNRLIMYSSNYFHSKFPRVIDKGKRVVLVSFYTMFS